MNHNTRPTNDTEQTNMKLIHSDFKISNFQQIKNNIDPNAESLISLTPRKVEEVDSPP